MERQQRSIASIETKPLAGGQLHVIKLQKRRTDSAAADRAARWTEEKVIRVWTHASYSREGAPPGGWPVLYMHDGQNSEWGAEEGGYAPRGVRGR